MKTRPILPRFRWLRRHLTILQTEIQKLDDLGADKVSATSGSKDVTINRGDLRDALKDAMQDISDMWKPMAKNYENAQNKFRMPYGSDQLLIDTAGSFVEEAAPLEADFIARGMPDEFYRRSDRETQRVRRGGQRIGRGAFGKSRCQRAVYRAGQKMPRGGRRR